MTLGMTKDYFKALYNLPPDIKVIQTKAKIREFYANLGGNVFLSFSGGKDSTVLAHIIRSMEAPYNEIEFVFFDTHNEDKSIYEMVEFYEATVVSSPKTPNQIIEEVGYPLFNKEIAHIIDAMQRKLPYIQEEGRRSEQNKKLIKKVKDNYMLFVNSPLRISDKCCDESKKKPSKQFTKETGKYPILGILAVESFLRMQQYLRRGCNSFEGKIQSTPIGFWKKDDILWYIAQNNLKIADCYKAKITTHKLLGYKTCKLCGKTQTGCLYCGFGKGVEYAKKILKAKCPEYVLDHQEEFDSLY